MKPAALRLFVRDIDVARSPSGSIRPAANCNALGIRGAEIERGD